MFNLRFFRYGLRNVCSKLTTLRDSCAGVYRTEIYPPSFTWFGGAAAICQEAIDRIKDVLLFLEETEKRGHLDDCEEG